MANHRADKRALNSGPRSAGGRRKATKPASFVRHPLTGLPILPTMAGAVVVAAAASGAIGAGAQEAQAAPFANAGAINPSTFTDFETLGVAPRSDSRQRAISRDSGRNLTQAVAERELQSAAERQARQRTVALHRLARASKAQAKTIVARKATRRAARRAWTLPTTGYRLTGRFGQASGLWSGTHTGLDFATTSGTPIVAVATGTVTETGWAGSYGNRTIETLQDGTEIWYAHELAITANPGQVVRSGQQIGAVGSTGNSTGSHVHIEVRPGGGDPVDPYTALIYHGLQP